MAEIFRIDIVASPQGAVRGVRSVETELERLNRTAASTNSLLRGALQFTGIGVGLVAIQRITSKVIEFSDAFAQVQNQLSFVTRGTEELSRVTEQLFGVANRSRSSFEATAKLYARTALAADQLGLSQEGVVGIAETLNKAIILSGASAKEASNGLIQLSQAIASNRLGGDELRSVLEQLPVVADAISRSLGVTRGQLRELGAQGLLTARTITDALQLAAGRIDAAFSKTVPTIGQALQVVENQLIRFFGAANKATGASQKLAAALIFLGDNIENILFGTTAFVAALNVSRLVKFAQGLATAALEARQFARFQAEAVRIAEASAIATARDEAATEAATLARVEAAASVAQVERFRAAATTQAATATVTAARATVGSVEADLAKVESLTALTRAEIARLQATAGSAQASAAAARAEQLLLALQSVRGETVRRLALAEGALAEATFAVVTAQQAEIGALAQAAGLQALSAAQVERAALAQRNLNTVLAGTPGLLARVSVLLRANAIGIAVTAVTALVVGLIGLRDLLNTVSSGFGLVAQAASSTTTFFRELAESVPVVGGAFSAVLKTLLGIGAIVAAVFLAPVSPILALTLAIGGLLTLAGTGKQVFNAFGGAARSAIAEAEMIAPIGREILQVRKELEPLEAEFERLAKRRDEGLDFGGLRDAEIRIEELRKRLVELGEAAKRQQGIGASTIITTAFERRNELLREEIALLGKSRFEREVGLQLLKEEESFLKASRRKFTPDEKETRRQLVEARIAAQDLAAVLDEVREKRGPDVEFARLKRLLDESGVSAELYDATLAELTRRKVDASPLAQGLKELRDITLDLARAPVLTEVTFAGGTSPRQMLDEFRQLNREREIQAEIQARTEQIQSGLTPEELAIQRAVITEQVRANAERARRNQLDEQFLQLQSEQTDAQALALIPDDFERSVQAAVQAQRELKDASLQLTEAQIRQGLAIQEIGVGLQNLQDPVLAQARAQDEVAQAIARTNAEMALGQVTASEYAIRMQDLEFQAARVGTTFTDGVVVALRQMEASTTLATLGSTALTGAIDAAADAAAEFARTGTVDFRRLALSLIADITRIIIKLLILEAIQAATGTSAPVATPKIITPGSSFVQGAFAEGGPFRANQPFIVGERGPELVQFGRSGSVTSNDRVVEAMAQAAARGGGQTVVPAPAVNVAVVNVSDPDAALDAMDTPAGARVILNQMSRNPQAARRAVGG